MALVTMPGEELITQGWPNNQMFFLRNNAGYVDLVIKQDGKEQIIDTLGGGACFGEAALLPLPSPEALQKVKRLARSPSHVYRFIGTSCSYIQALFR